MLLVLKVVPIVGVIYCFLALLSADAWSQVTGRMHYHIQHDYATGLFLHEEGIVEVVRHVRHLDVALRMMSRSPIWNLFSAPPEV